MTAPTEAHDVSVPGFNTNSGGSKKLTTKTYSHIMAYPLVSDATSAADRSQVLKVIHSYLSLALTRLVGLLSGFSLVVTVLNAIDKRTDNALNYLDKTFPSLTSFSFEDITKNISQRYNRVTSSLVKNIRGSYANATGAVRSRLRFIVKRFNDLYESAVDSVLPAKEKAEAAADDLASSASGEVARTRALLRSTYERTLPYVNQVTRLPQYVNEVYNNEKADSSAPVALAKTSRRLSNEAYESTIKPTYDSRIKPTVDRFIGSTKTSVNGTVEALDEQVAKVGAEVEERVAKVIDVVEDAVEGGAPANGTL